MVTDAAFGSIIDLLVSFVPGDRTQLFFTGMWWGIQGFDISRPSSTLFPIFLDLDDAANEHTKEDDSPQDSHDDQSCTEHTEACISTCFVPSTTGQASDWISFEVTLVATLDLAHWGRVVADC